MNEPKVNGFGKTMRFYKPFRPSLKYPDLWRATLALLLSLTFGVASPPARADLYVTSRNNDQVMRYDGATGAPVGSGVFASGLNEPWGLAFGPDGNLYIASQDNDVILRYNPTTGAPLPSPGNSGAVFANVGAPDTLEPFGVTFGPDRNLYVSVHDPAGTNDDTVMRYNGTTGAPLPSPGNSGAVFVAAHSAGLNDPNGVAFGSDGNLYVASTNGVLRFNGTTGAPIGSGLFGSAGGFFLAFGPDGNLYTTIPTSGVLRFDGTTGAPLPSPGNSGDIFVPAGSAGLSDPGGLAFGPDGNLYVSSRITNEVLRYNATTGAPVGSGIFISAGSAGLDDPTYLVFTPQPSAAVPEPASSALLGIGAACLYGYYWRRRQRV